MKIKKLKLKTSLMITLNSKNFSHAINACSKLIKGNNTLPILDNFKIDINGNIMILHQVI